MIPFFNLKALFGVAKNLVKDGIQNLKAGYLQRSSYSLYHNWLVPKCNRNALLNNLWAYTIKSKKLEPR